MSTKGSELGLKNTVSESKTTLSEYLCLHVPIFGRFYQGYQEKGVGSIKETCVYYGKKIPLIGGFFEYPNAKDFTEAFKEAFVILLFSIVPIMFVIVVKYACLGKDDTSSWEWFWNVLKGNLDRGEILIYSMSFFSTVVFVFYKYNREEKPFSNTLSFLLSSVLIIGFSSLLFALIKANVIVNKDVNDYLFVSSVILYFASLTLMWIALVYNNALSDKTTKSRINELKDYNVNDEAKSMNESLNGWKPEE